MAVIGFFVFLGIVVLEYTLNGLAVSVLWNWYVTPLGLPNLSIPWAIGISIIVGFLTNHNKPKEGEKIDVWSALGYSLLRPAFAIFVGWIVAHWLRG